MTNQIAAVVATTTLFILSLFQVLLMAKAPLGHFAWGGANRVLPDKLRVASFFSLILYVLFTVIILENAKFTSLITNTSITDIGIWILTIYFGFGIFFKWHL